VNTKCTRGDAKRLHPPALVLSHHSKQYYHNEKEHIAN